MLAPGHPKHHEAVRPGSLLGDRARRLAGQGNVSWKSSGIDRSVPGHGRGARVERGFALGIDWMDRDGLSQAIPPAYTEWIGTQLLVSLRAVA